MRVTVRWHLAWLATVIPHFRRAVVLSDDRTGDGELVMNAEFLRFSAHWGFVARPCRAYRPDQGQGWSDRSATREGHFHGGAFAGAENLKRAGGAPAGGRRQRPRPRRDGGERPSDRFERVSVPLAPWAVTFGSTKEGTQWRIEHGQQGRSATRFWTSSWPGQDPAELFRSGTLIDDLERRSPSAGQNTD